MRICEYLITLINPKPLNCLKWTIMLGRRSFIDAFLRESRNFVIAYWVAL